MTEEPIDILDFGFLAKELVVKDSLTTENDDEQAESSDD
jgi:hypothetical protein